jgi:hypothetical protein
MNSNDIYMKVSRDLKYAYVGGHMTKLSPEMHPVAVLIRSK